MQRTVFVVLALLSCAAVQAQVGSINVPADLPADIKDWAEHPGCYRLPPCEVKLANAVMEYDLYIAPNKPAIYAISHYRIRPTEATGMFKEAAKDYHGLEVVFWFPKPGVAGVVHRVFIKRDDKWTEAPPDSPQWRLESAIVNRLWRVRADALDAEETLATTTF